MYFIRIYPTCSMCGVFSFSYHRKWLWNRNGKRTVHGAFGEILRISSGYVVHWSTGKSKTWKNIGKPLTNYTRRYTDANGVHKKGMVLSICFGIKGDNMYCSWWYPCSMLHGGKPMRHFLGILWGELSHGKQWFPQEMVDCPHLRGESGLFN